MLYILFLISSLCSSSCFSSDPNIYQQDTFLQQQEFKDLALYLQQMPLDPSGKLVLNELKKYEQKIEKLYKAYMDVSSIIYTDTFLQDPQRKLYAHHIGNSFAHFCVCFATLLEPLSIKIGGNPIANLRRGFEFVDKAEKLDQQIRNEFILATLAKPKSHQILDQARFMDVD